MKPDHQAEADRVGAYWDALVLGQETPSIDLDPELAEAIRRFQAMGATPPSTARERVWRNVQTAIAHQNESENPMQSSLVLGRSRPFAQVSSLGARSRPWKGRTRWAPTQLATAVLLVLTVVAGLVAFGPWRPGASPPGGNHHLAAVPAVASPEALPTLAEFVGEIALDLAGTDSSAAAAGVAIAADGTLYVIDARNNQIRVFDPDGAPMATWGESCEGPGQFKFTGMGFLYGDLAIGPDGNLYVMDTANSRIQVFAPDGTYLREWGERGSEEGQFAVPSGIGIDAAGRVYVTETGNRRLQIFDSDGQFVAAWEPTEDEGGPFLDPADVAIDAVGTVSVTDYDKNQIFRFDAKGTVLETLGIEQQYRAGEAEQPGYLSQPWGAEVDAQGNLYVAEYGGHRVQVFAPDGAALGVIEGVASESGQFGTSIFVAVSPDGLLYLADNRNGRVQVFRLLPPLVLATGTPMTS